MTNGNSTTNSTHTQSTGDRAVKIDVVMDRTGFGRTRVYAMIKNGEFPAPTKFGRQSRWSERAIDAWLSERFATH
nr:AlpA family phage regulatory protein [Luteibacter rhizovicinus]